jgi:hypothetical protein
MKYFFLIVIALMLIGNGVDASELSGACLGKTEVSSVASSEAKLLHHKSTDKYRFQDGKVFHQYKGRKEYKYNKIEVSAFNPNHFLSGNMRFVFNNNQSGYVIIADKLTWKVVYLDCALKRK